MGSGASTPLSRESVVAFKNSCEWMCHSGRTKTDDEIAEYLGRKLAELNSSSEYKHDSESPKYGGDEIRRASVVMISSAINLGLENSSSPKRVSRPSTTQQKFMDSVYIKSWLGNNSADDLFEALKSLEPQPYDLTKSQQLKYPLTTIYYGVARRKDGARALDRWGSYHESWCRVREPPECLNKLRDKVVRDFGLSPDGANSIVVNYYWNGSNTYIPAHRDTVACLEDGSQIICVSLGASRDFVLCDNNDCGKFKKDEMSVTKEWRVGHGDVFALGQDTNTAYCHAVTQETVVQNLRISIIIRSISKSFIKFDGVEEKNVTLASGKVKAFKAMCLVTRTYGDQGTPEHIADLVAAREDKKRAKAKAKALLMNGSGSGSEGGAVGMGMRMGMGMGVGSVEETKQMSSSASSSSLTPLKLLDHEDPSRYYMGAGMEVPTQI